MYFVLEILNLNFSKLRSNFVELHKIGSKFVQTLHLQSFIKFQILLNMKNLILLNFRKLCEIRSNFEIFHEIRSKLLKNFISKAKNKFTFLKLCQKSKFCKLMINSMLKYSKHCKIFD